jgi:hypothetical protein
MNGCDKTQNGISLNELRPTSILTISNFKVSYSEIIHCADICKMKLIGIRKVERDTHNGASLKFAISAMD